MKNLSTFTVQIVSIVSSHNCNLLAMTMMLRYQNEGEINTENKM